jgi:hypothetical protein
MKTLANRTATVRTLITAVVAFALLAILGTAQAGILFSDDFESRTVDQQPSTGTGTGDWSDITIGGDGQISVRNGDSPAGAPDQDFSPFGSANQYLEVSQGTNTDNVLLEKEGANGASGSPVVSLRFDFFHASDNPFQSSGTGSGLFVIRLADDLERTGSSSKSDRIVQLSFENGTVTNDSRSDGGTSDATASYDLDTAFRVTYVLNNSNSTINYGGGLTLASGAIDLWFDDTRVIAGNSVRELDALGNNVDDFEFRIFSSRQNVAAFADNVRFHNEAIRGVAIIPEPASLVLLALGGLALLRRPRRR